MLSAVCALPGAAASAAIAVHKLELTLVQTFARGIGGGLLISLAILLATTAVRNHGNIADIFVAAFLPISARQLLWNPLNPLAPCRCRCGGPCSAAAAPRQRLGLPGSLPSAPGLGSQLPPSASALGFRHRLPP